MVADRHEQGPLQEEEEEGHLAEDHLQGWDMVEQIGTEVDGKQTLATAAVHLVEVSAHLVD